MPPRSSPPSEGHLLDTWGRANRTLSDRPCKNCGEPFRPAKSSSSYCSRRCSWNNNGGHNKKPESWWVNSKGYVEGRIWDGNKQRRVKRHRLIAEQHLGRPLLPSEDAHHADEDKLNNDPANIIVIDHGKHSTLHNLGRTYRHGYKLNLTREERMARSERMKLMRHPAIAKATGQ